MNGEEQRMARNRKAVRNAQKRELLYVGYYGLLIVEYIYRLLTWTPKEVCNGFVDAYNEVSLIKEQKRKQKFSSWVRDRKKYYWITYIC